MFGLKKSISVTKNLKSLSSFMAHVIAFPGLPHELLKDVEFGDVCIEDLEEEETDREAIGFDLMKRAAALGDQLAVTFVADAYYTGRNMGKFA